MKGYLKKFNETPHQIDVENSSTIEGTLKKFKDNPLKTTLKSPVIVEADKTNFNYFQSKGPQWLPKISITIEGT